MKLIALTCALLCGCAGAELPSPQTARIAANELGRGLNRVKPLIDAVCEPEPEPPMCIDARDAWETQITPAYHLVHDSIETWNKAVSP
ncbi:MAG TPA: hypothetical protein VHM19_08850 [Polyangiales bacterium]|jgi:hypothetical protein|nr:hypothetical protein [Polyangiales bacterium]